MRSERIGEGVLEHWTPEEVRAALERDEIHLVDLRDPEQQMMGTIGGAELVPMPTFAAEDLPGGDGKPVVLYCNSGGRSRRIAESILQEGAGKIAHLEGGIGAWKRSGLPTD